MALNRRYDTYEKLEEYAANLEEINQLQFDLIKSYASFQRNFLIKSTFEVLKAPEGYRFTKMEEANGSKG
jgi:hypothetical protein